MIAIVLGIAITLGCLLVWAIVHYVFLWELACTFCDTPRDESRFYSKIYFVPFYFLSKAKVRRLQSGDPVKYAMANFLHRDGQYTRVVREFRS